MASLKRTLQSQTQRVSRADQLVNEPTLGSLDQAFQLEKGFLCSNQYVPGMIWRKIKSRLLL